MESNASASRAGLASVSKQTLAQDPGRGSRGERRGKFVRSRNLSMGPRVGLVPREREFVWSNLEPPPWGLALRGRPPGALETNSNSSAARHDSEHEQPAGRAPAQQLAGCCSRSRARGSPETFFPFLRDRPHSTWNWAGVLVGR